MLFGIDSSWGIKENNKYFIKDYWNTNNNYDLKINEADPFIIYGMSLGKSDASWWRNIVKRLEEGAKLIIYTYDKEISRDKVLRHFLSYSYNKETIIGKTEQEVQKKIEEKIDELEENIVIVFHNEDKEATAFNVSPITK